MMTCASQRDGPGLRSVSGELNQTSSVGSFSIWAPNPSGGLPLSSMVIYTATIQYPPEQSAYSSVRETTSSRSLLPRSQIQMIQILGSSHSSPHT